MNYKRGLIWSIVRKAGIYCVISLLLLLGALLHVQTCHASEKWAGVDESVVEKYAKEHGREASEPLINTDQGDLLLFVFLLAGAVGGFAAGYYWRTLIENRNQNKEMENRAKGK